MTLRQDIEASTPALRRLAQALVLRDAGAIAHPGDDLVQETLLRALRHEAPAPGLSIRNWLYANLVALNRQRQRSLAAEGVAGESLAHGNATGARPAGRRRLASLPANDVSGALQHLALEEREALLLVVLEGLSYSHAAMVLGLPRPVLIARLGRARASLIARTGPAQPRHAQPPAHLRLVT